MPGTSGKKQSDAFCVIHSTPIQQPSPKRQMEKVLGKQVMHRSLFRTRSFRFQEVEPSILGVGLCRCPGALTCLQNHPVLQAPRFCQTQCVPAAACCHANNSNNSPNPFPMPFPFQGSHHLTVAGT